MLVEPDHLRALETVSIPGIEHSPVEGVRIVWNARYPVSVPVDEINKCKPIGRFCEPMLADVRAWLGYLLQGIMLLVKSRAVLAVAVGLLFAVAGAFYALVTLFDGGLELAAGYHMINNLFMGVVSNTEDAVIETPALFTVHSQSYELFPNLVIEIVIFAVAILALNAKYKWFRVGVGQRS